MNDRLGMSRNLLNVTVQRNSLSGSGSGRPRVRTKRPEALRQLRSPHEGARAPWLREEGRLLEVPHSLLQRPDGVLQGDARPRRRPRRRRPARGARAWRRVAWRGWDRPPRLGAARRWARWRRTRRARARGRQPTGSSSTHPHLSCTHLTRLLPSLGTTALGV